MRLILLITLACNISFAGNFEDLLKKYEQSAQPSQEQLMKRNWMLVKMYSNYSLSINKDHIDYADKNGIKNRDGSQMLWRFEGYDHPLYRFTLSKLNFIQANRNHLAIRVHFSNETNSLVYAFSAYLSGKKNDIYYIQHCRLSSEASLICPATLKVTQEALDLYKDARLVEANNQITVIQEFVAQ